MKQPGGIRRGDVVLVPFPYVSDFRKAKTRPALVVQNNTGNRFGSTLIVALISSAVPETRYPMHHGIAYPSAAAAAAGLRKSSVIKMETLVTLPKRAVLRRLGRCPGRSCARLITPSPSVWTLRSRLLSGGGSCSLR